jgi:hypothetical protein
MSDSEPFVARWSRLKRDKLKERETRKPGEPGSRPAAGETAKSRASEVEPTPTPQSDPAQEPFDVSFLPPVESITAGSDIRAFLQSGVPAELTKAALRRAWTTDPAIRDFIGLAENQWDFTDPTAIPGFGPLEPGDDVRRLVAQAMGKLEELGGTGAVSADPAAADQSGVGTVGSDAGGGVRLPEQVPGMPERNDASADRPASVEGQDHEVSGASQHVGRRAENLSTSNRRGHGRALPQ